MHDTQYIISCLVTLNQVTRIPVKDYSHMWCEASLTGFLHMMLYEQTANDDNCPEKSVANVLLILGHFQQCLTCVFGSWQKLPETLNLWIPFFISRRNIMLPVQFP